MKVIIAGSRYITDTAKVTQAIRESKFPISEVVSGGAAGVDYIAISLAMLHRIPYKEFPAQWRHFGHAAGPIRNQEMAVYADALIAVWDGVSRGTKNMIEEMKKRDKPVFVFKVETNSSEEEKENKEKT